jgi:hypothetical protein
MSILQPLTRGPGYLKAGFFGFPKTGKTFTAFELAFGVREFFKLEAPIVMFDTEGGSDFFADIHKKRTGKELIGLKSRSFDDLKAVAKEAAAGAASVLIVDSVTHIWRELQDAYLAGVNEKLASLGRSPRYRLEFQDWGIIKNAWAAWTDFYLNSPLHIIILARAGYEYDYEVNEETQKKELIKGGTKMKVESEFGFEPSLIIEMTRERDGDGYARYATCLGDRWNTLDGHTSKANPKFDFFKPHVMNLLPANHTQIDTTSRSSVPNGVAGDGSKRYAILLEEIEATIVAMYPGQTAVEKKAKAALVEEIFKTGSWTKVSTLPFAQLEAGLHELKIRRTELEAYNKPATAEEAK